MTYNTVKRHKPSKGLNEKNAGAPSSPTIGDDLLVLGDSENSDRGVYAKGRNVQTRDISGDPANERTGFVLGDGGTADSSQLAWDDDTQTLTVSFVAAPPGNFKVWTQDIEHIRTSDSVTITDTEGLWYFYYSLDGVLTATQTFARSLLLGPQAFVAYGYWDATNKKMVLDLFDERHGMQMNGASHLHWHEYIGATYGSGFALNSLQVDQGPPVGTDAYAQFGVDSGTFQDEDLNFPASAVTSTTGLPILYLSGAGGVNLRETSEAGYSVQTDVTAGVGVTGRLVYNDLTTGTRVVVPNGDFVLCHVFVTGANTDAKRIYSIMGDATYNNKNDAEDGANTEIANLKQLLPIAEILPIATVIFQTSDTYTNAVKARVVSTDSGDDYVDWRFSGVAQGTGASPSDHNLLSNRSDPNSHPASAVTNDESALDNFLAFVAAAANADVQDLVDQIDELGLSGAAKTWRFTGVLTPAQLTASVNDYAPTGYDAVTTLRLDSDASHNITGLVPPADDSYLYILQNVGANNIVLTNEDAASTAANRFDLTADFTLEPGAQAIVVYDAVSNRWRLVGGGAGGGIGVAEPDLYSETETKLPGQWWQDPNSLTDYYPYYVKKVDLGTLPNASTKDVAHGISNAHIDSVEVEGLSTDGTFSIPLNNADDTIFWLSTTNLRFVTTIDRSTLTGYAIVKYAKTTDTPVTRDDAYGNGLAGQPDLYSETETKLPGQWWQDPNSLTDYYPYYVKKVDLGSLPNATTKNVAHGITNAHLDSVKVSGTCNSGIQAYPLPFVADPASSSIRLQWQDATNLLIDSAGADRTSFTGYAYVKYAKTTDTPVTRDEAYGNGGAGFDDYSTSETVTNKRWLGNTVYRKVVSLTNKPNASSASNAHGISSISEIIHLEVKFKISGNYLVINGNSTISTGNDEFCFADSTNVYWDSGSNRTTATEAYAIIEYTKP